MDGKVFYIEHFSLDMSTMEALICEASFCRCFWYQKMGPQICMFVTNLQVTWMEFVSFLDLGCSLLLCFVLSRFRKIALSRFRKSTRALPLKYLLRISLWVLGLSLSSRSLRLVELYGLISFNAELVLERGLLKF